MLSHSVVSDSVWPHGLQPARLLYPWDFPSKNTGVGCCFLLHGIFPTQGSNPCPHCLLHCRQILYLLSHGVSHPNPGEEESGSHRWEKRWVHLTTMHWYPNKNSLHSKVRNLRNISIFRTKITKINCLGGCFCHEKTHTDAPVRSHTSHTI